MEVVGFLAYGLALALPTLAISLLIVFVTNIDAKYMYPIWMSLILIMLWTFDIHLLLSRFF
jgi:hypothetical protein